LRTAIHDSYIKNGLEWGLFIIRVTFNELLQL